MLALALPVIFSRRVVESRRLAAIIPDARLEMLDGAGHMIMLERTDVFHHLLLDFARDVGTLPATAGAA